VRTRVRVRYQFKFVAVADGSSVKAISFGEAHDTADKALNKAETAAYKKALIRTFTIAAGEDDPDSIDPNQQDEERAAAPGARRTRRQQSMDRARGTGGRTPAPTVPAPETPAPKGPAEPIEQHDALEPEADVAIATREAEVATVERERGQVVAQAASEQAAPGARRRRHTAQTVTEAKAEQQAQTWAPDQEDIDAAEQMSTATEQHLAGNPPRVDAAYIPAPTGKDVAGAEQNAPQAPAAPPAPPTTQTEQRAEAVSEVKSALRRAWSARGLTRDQANNLGDKVTGKPRTEWMLNLNDLRRVLKAIENGETAE
jgi:hypothetical protein